MTNSSPKIETVNKNIAHDKDLVELAGYHAYRGFGLDENIKVNGNQYKVVDTLYNQDSGLDALTVENFETGEIIIVYVGTDASQFNDIKTDAQLLIGQAIRNNGGAILGIDGVQHTNTYTLEQSPYLLMKMKLKEAHVELAFSRFSTLSHGMLIPLLSKLHVLTFAIEGSLDTISTSIKGATHFAFNGTLTGKLIGLFSDFDDQVKSKMYSSLEPIDELASTIRGIRKALNQLILGYPNLLTNFKPYLDSAIFSNNNFFNVHLYNLASINILKEMEILFADIIHQLSSQQAVSIDVLVDVSKKVKQNMGILQEQVERGTIS
ncbi:MULTISPECIES: hypothetical protein [unclassified Sutcliffiella]|uniref:hypothetical protein n=1 Tax=unclassified Sutcliffiella TaxID=2837532 RepID=UPI0030CCF089